MHTATYKHFNFANKFHPSDQFIPECRLLQACEFYQVNTLNLVKNLQIPGKKKKGIIGLDS